LGAVVVSLTYDEIVAMSPNADEFSPEPLPMPRPPTPLDAEEVASLFDEDSDRPNPADPFTDPYEDHIPDGSIFATLAIEEAAAWIDQSVASIPNWPPPTVMPVCLRPFAEHLVPHPLCPGFSRFGVEWSS
jgi:hypothetical protein